MSPPARRQDDEEDRREEVPAYDPDSDLPWSANRKFVLTAIHDHERDLTEHHKRITALERAELIREYKFSLPAKLFAVAISLLTLLGIYLNIWLTWKRP